MAATAWDIPGLVRKHLFAYKVRFNTAKPFNMLLYATISVLSLILPAIDAQTPTPLTQSQINTYTPYTYFAAAAFCDRQQLLNWACGANCLANKQFSIESDAIGGDATTLPTWFVGYSAIRNEVIVSYMDIDEATIEKSFSDANVLLSKPDASLFPGLASTVQAETGFLSVHKSLAPKVLHAVRNALTKYPKATKVTLTGLGVGGAIAQLELLHLSLNLPKTTVLKAVTYGVPRVGNQQFADLYNNLKLTHINNKRDPVGNLPPKIEGYRAVAGEIYIDKGGVWKSCPGQENKDCLQGNIGVQDMLTGWDDHSGPYNGVNIRC